MLPPVPLFGSQVNINSTHTPLNLDDGGLLSDAYLHLIKKKGS